MPASSTAPSGLGPAPDPAPGRSATSPRMSSRQKLVLALLLGSQFMIAVDFSILNVALPVVGEGLGFSLAGETGWTRLATLAALAAGAALLAAFVRIEQRAAAPLVPVRVLKRRSVVWGNTAGLVAFATETSLVFLLTLYLQEVLGYSALATGLAFGVLGAGTVVGGVLGGRAVGRFGNRRAIVLGGTVQAAATLSLVALGTSGAWIWLLLAATFVGGAGNMLMIVGFMVTATSGLPDEEQGRATGLATMPQQVGIALGIPVMSAVVTARMGAANGPGAVLSGVSTAILVNSALVLAGAVLAGYFLAGGARRPKDG